MSERRRLLRKYLIIYSRVFERPTGKLLGYLADLNEDGAMIIAEEPLAVGAVLSLRLDLPDPKLFDAYHLNVSARVAHCSPDLSPELYDIGLEFRDVTPDHKAVIEKMMEVYEFRRENGPR